jgi:acyl carrier protein
MSVEQDAEAIITQILNVLPEELKLDERLYDSLGVDSTEIVELVIALEKKFGIEIEDKRITKFSSPREIIALVASKIGTS